MPGMYSPYTVELFDPRDIGMINLGGYASNPTIWHRF